MFVLFVVFLVLKLTSTVPWSWWIITLPLWIGFVVTVGIILLIILIIAIGFAISMACIGLWGLMVWFFSLFKR